MDGLTGSERTWAGVLDGHDAERARPRRHLMRLLPDGPELPDGLVRQQERGEVLFVCGAGASMTVGLPSFASLVQGVYSRLGESWEHHHAEAEIMLSGRSMSGQYDRALRCLERRLAANDVRGAGGLRRRIRAAVDAELVTGPGANLSNHLALMQLSRGSDGVPRLLTTNFDPLFERAWSEAGHAVPASHAGASMPRQGTSAFEGVLHLHGRIEDSRLGLAATDLVLTSAEFGDAYLRSGWASRYVYDLARALTLILVGYQADDPPMRYLLEALEDDRARYPDLRPVYAFAPAHDGEENLQRAMWTAKGIEPIIYRIDDAAGHGRLYGTLQAWRDYAAAPSAWRASRLGAIFAHPYAAGREADLSEAVDLLRREDAARLLAAVAPDASWWAPLSGCKALRDCPDALRVWIARRRDDRDMLRACVANQLSDSSVYDMALSSAMPASDPDVARGWRLLAKVAQAPRGDASMAWYGMAGRIHAGEIDHDVRTAVVRSLQPRLQVSAPFDWPSRSEREELPRRKPFIVDFVAEGDPASRNVLSAWPDDTVEQLRLLWVANRALGEALDQAMDAGYLDDADRASATVPSLAGRVEFEQGFAPLVLVIAGLWTRVVARDPVSARAVASAWWGSTLRLHVRLWLHVLTRPGLFDGIAVAEALASLDDESFWFGEVGREAIVLMEARWADLESGYQAALLDRTLAGPPRHDLGDPDDERWRLVRDWLLFQRLEPLRRLGSPLRSDARDELAAIVARNPGNALVLPADEPEPRGGLIESNTVSIDDDLADEQLVPTILKGSTGDWLAQDAAWRTLCTDDPLRALRGISAAGQVGTVPATLIVSLLSVACESEVPGLQEGTADFLLSGPAQPFDVRVAVSAARWIWQRAERASEGSAMPARMLDVWDRLSDGLLVPEAACSPMAIEATLEEALNAAGGLLALALLAWVGRRTWTAGEGFGPEFSARLDRLSSASGKTGLHARLLLVRQLAYLHQVSPRWALDAFVPRLTWGHPEARSLWRVRAGERVGRAELFNALKPGFLEAVLRAVDRPNGADGLAHTIVQVSRWRQDPVASHYDLDAREARSLLSRAPAAVRHCVSWRLWRLLAGAKDEKFDRANCWRREVGPLFAAVWPLDAAAQDDRSSRNLAMMAMEAGEALPEAVEEILDFIVPWEVVTIDGGIRPGEAQRAAAERHGPAFLRLLDRCIGPSPVRVPMDLGGVLDGLLAVDQSIAVEPTYVRLDGLRRRGGI